ncbi:hypothetical protein HYALB_00002844 [Hymenoscyphus albidus]|uniref:Cellulose-binding Sde182 C-terminal domain-containing protein n=1 Tax=Hymenoscyphus albidus TaxID=595503 RepID=A0A9N9LE40_9HELO|nr:hypothetical protein HYALB_00002844 [Hymenoscyphus albidus]
MEGMGGEWSGGVGKGCVIVRDEGISPDQPLWSDTADTVIGEDGKSYKTNHATVWRWRRTFQNDFVTRMQWTLTSNFSNATHPAVVRVNGHLGPEPLVVPAGYNQSFVFDASETYDPDHPEDNSKLEFQWYQYGEPSFHLPDGLVTALNIVPTSMPEVYGTLTSNESGFQNVTLGQKVEVTIPSLPETATEKPDLHLILQVRSKMASFPVTRYRESFLGWLKWMEKKRGLLFLAPMSCILGGGFFLYALTAWNEKKASNLPIYTPRIPGVRLSVINSLDLVPVVQRQWRTLIFAPIQVKAAQAAMGASKGAVEVMNRDFVTENGFINGMVKATHPSMIKGPALNALNSKAFEIFDDALRFERPSTVNLFVWVGKIIMHATTDAIYGPSNPMRDGKNLEGWHKYRPALMLMMLDILPQKLLFRNAVGGREHLVKSFANYYHDGSYKQGSAYIRQFVEHCIKQQLPEDDIPRLLLGTVFNNIANTIPAAFWLIYHLFSDPAVLKDCQKEVRGAVSESQDGVSVNLSVILNSCPILNSIYQEVFRYHGTANSKGGLVMVSGRSRHTNAEVWGEDVDKFYYRRFVKQSSKSSNPVAFRGFGGGVTLCPGRHFATSEILLLATLSLLRCDIRPKNDIWEAPSRAMSSQAEAVDQPDYDIEVEVIHHTENSGKPWKLVFEGDTSS